jgi:FMN phosphatase YigB (HAD superfamily)
LIHGRTDLTGVRLVSWDVDGTLYQPLAVRLAIALRFGAACLAGRGPRLYRAVAAFQRARSRLEQLRRGDAPATPAADPERSAFERELLLPALASVGPRPGVAEVLGILAARGLVQVAFSDYPAEEKIRALGLERSFVAFYAGETRGAPKPSPAVLAAIGADFSVSPGQMIHIGDRLDTDGAAAAAFGCRALILGRDFRDFSALARTLRG